MANGFEATDATGATVEILTEQVTDPDLAITAEKQYVGVIGGAGSTNKLAIDSSGRAKVDASGVAVPVTDNSGTLSVDDGGGTLTVDGTLAISSGPAASRLTDSIAAALAVDALMNGLTALSPLFASITASASGATTIVSAVASKKIRVHGIILVCTTAVTVKLQSHTTTATATGTMPFGANGGVATFIPVGCFDTVAGEALDIVLGGAVAVGGQLVYTTV